MKSAIVRIDESRVEVELIDLVKFRPEAFGWNFRYPQASLIDVWREKQLSCGLHRSTACAAPIPPAPWRFRCRRGLPPQRTPGSPDHSEPRARDQDARPLQALPFRF